MLKLSDALRLAGTKLVSRKLWTGLFIGLEIIALALVLLLLAAVRGFENSLNAFNSEGLNGKFLVSAANIRTNPDLADDPDTWDLAEQLYQEAIAYKSALAAEYGVEYSSDSEIAPTEYVDGQRQAVLSSPYLTAAIEQLMEGYLEADQSDLEAILQNYSYSRLYKVQALVADGQVTNLLDGEEDLANYELSAATNQDQRLFSGVNVLDDELYADYLFSDYEVDADAIPVVISTAEAATLLGLESAPSDASARATYYAELREQVAGLVVETCYRNDASIQQIYTAEQILDEIARGETLESYERPSLVYALPTETCGAVTIAEDTRTDAEKTAAAAQTAFQAALGETTEPVQQLVKFQIVGLVPAESTTASGNDVLSMLQSLGGVSLVTPLISQSYYDAHVEELSQIYGLPDASLDYYGMSESFIIEFADADTARALIANESCDYSGSANLGCATTEHLFYFSAENNNSLVIQDISRTFERLVLTTTVVLLIVTFVLIALMVVRSIASDRKEIAIFRAIGFSQGKIMQIYLSYAFLMTLIIVVGALLLAVGLGLALNPLLSDLLTQFFSGIFYTLDPDLSADLFAPKWTVWAALCLAMVGVSLVSALLAVGVKGRSQIIDGLKYE